MYFSAPSASGAGSFQPGSAANATSVVELSISARNLRDMDVFSKSDPMCVIYTMPFGGENFVEFKRTECIQNCLNPNFTVKPHLNYHFEEQQRLRFEVYDLDNNSHRLSDHDFIGYCECTLGQIVSSGRTTLELLNPEFPSGGNGQLVLSTEELSMCKDEMELQFMAKKLEKSGWFGSLDPYLEISRTNEQGAFTVVHRTQYLRSNQNPVWPKFVLSMRSLCNGDLDRSLRFESYDYRKNGDHVYIGEFSTTVRQLMKGPGEENTYQCINKNKQKSKKNYKNSGLIHLIHCDVRKAYTFLDYVRGGTDLACTISIDFTASNGSPNTPESLHYYSPYGGTMNQYELAIRSVGEIISDYDSDKLFPVLGFGARLPPNGQISHSFYVNGHTSNPYCEGIDGVLAAYKACLSRIQLYGPTNFAPTINHVAEIAKQFRDGSQYFILLIITDGIITDMPQTRTAIVAASTLPLSIIIVGVGQADFEAMEELDGDTVALTAPDGRVSARDIVQFVPFRNFTKFGINSPLARLHLAKEVLAEIPDQFLGFMKTNRIVPKASTGPPSSLPPDPEAIVGQH